MRKTDVPMLILIVGLVWSLSEAVPFSAVFAAGPADAPTLAQLRARVDAGEYQPVLPDISRAIQAHPADKFELLKLRGEIELHVPPVKAALESYKAAAAAAPEGDTSATAMVALLKRSAGTKYLPAKTKANPTPEPIDIVDLHTRKDAFAQLFNDLAAASRSQVDKAQQITTLPPLLDLARQVSDIRPVEIAATGKDEKSKDLLKSVADRGDTLMTDSLKDMNSQIKTLTTAAAKRIKQLGGNRVSKTEGLTLDEAQQLSSIVDQAKEIAQAAHDMQPVFGDAGNFKNIQSGAKKTEEQANALLTKYGRKPAA